MKKFKHICYIILLAGFISCNAVFALSIVKIPKIQAAGSVVFCAVKSVASNAVKWKAVPYYIDETSNLITYSYDTLKYDGDTAKFNLQKTSGKYTYYKIFAYEGVYADSIEVQVFIAGVVQKYLYSNPALSQYSVPVWIVLPSKYSSSSKYIMTMCGINRAAANIATYWVPFSNANNYVITAPEFNSKDWSSNDYILGKMFAGSYDTGTLNPKDYWSFNIVEQIHRQIYSLCGLKDSTYELWGHSAGGQFVHRLAFFLPDNLITRYIAANSGWYSCPDFNTAFPWGAQNAVLNLNSSNLTAFTEKKIVIMRGTADTIRDSELNTDPNSDAQGLNRFTRAEYFYNSGIKVNHDLKWVLVDIPNIGHDDQKMAVAAGSYIASNPVLVINDTKSVPEVFSLSNYPNPFNPETKIYFTLKRASYIQLAVYNILGKLVSYLADEYMNAGAHTYEFKAINLPSGVYLCRITGENINTTLKIQLLK